MDQVNGVDSDVLQAVMNIIFDVIWGITIVKGELPAAGPDAVLGRNLGGCEKTFVRVIAEYLAKQLLAVPIAVSPGCVEEI